MSTTEEHKSIAIASRNAWPGDPKFTMKFHLLATALIYAGIAVTAPAIAQNAPAAGQPVKLRSATDAKDQVRVTRVTP
ncbi:hypothetical protein, partial [Variovorax sp. WDL1]